MATSSREPGPNDIPFDDMPPSPRRLPNDFDPKRPRNSLSRALTPEYLGLDEAKYMDLTPEMIDAVQADALRPYLVDVLPKAATSPYAVSYYDPRQAQDRHIAVTPQEAKILPRHVEALKRNAAIGAAAKVTTELPTDADLARVERAKVHAQESKLPGLRTYHTAMLEQKALLAKFITNSRGSNYGLSMFGGEANMRDHLNYLQTFVIGDMVRAYSAQRHLNETQSSQVGRAIEYSYVFRAEKFNNFHALVEFLYEYNGHKLELARQRIVSIERGIGEQVVSRTKE
jgi:hypothetical protein